MPCFQNTLAARFNESDNIMDVELIYTTPMSGSQPTQHLSVWNKFMAAKVAPNIIPVPPYEGCRVSQRNQFTYSETKPIPFSNFYTGDIC